MKALINDPQAVVDEALEGFARANADIVALHTDPHWVGRAEKRAGGVAVVSGGGSGHEPLHAGFVGDGMLDGAVPGAMFTSPTPDAVFAAIEGSNTGDGVVLIVKNYTGDVLNFDMAAELAEASGIEVRTVLVADDVAVEDSTWTAGRRGVAGTVLVEKVAGAVAAGCLGGVELQCTVLAQRAVVHLRLRDGAYLALGQPGPGRPGRRPAP